MKESYVLMIDICTKFHGASPTFNDHSHFASPIVVDKISQMIFLGISGNGQMNLNACFKPKWLTFASFFIMAFFFPSFFLYQHLLSVCSQGPAGLKGGEGPQGPPGPFVSDAICIVNT